MHTEEFLFFLACFQSGQSIQKGNALVSYRLAVVPQHSVVRNLVSKGRDENQIYLDLFAAQGMGESADIRPYYAGNTSSRSLTEVKLHQATIVLQWETMWEHVVLNILPHECTGNVKCG